MQNVKKIDYKKTTKPRQLVWNYMRRNRNFRVGDIMMICGISQNYLQLFLQALLKVKYIKMTSSSRPYSNRTYVLLNDTGVKAPSVTKVGIYDNNTNETIVIGDRKAEENIYYPEVLMQILKYLSDVNDSTRKEILEKNDIKLTALEKWWNRLKKVGVVLDEMAAKNPLKKCGRKQYSVMYEKRDDYIVYEINKKRAIEIIDKLKNGAYKHKHKDMEHLWIQ